MATVTGITAERADEILGQSVIAANISPGGHIIFTRYDGSNFDGGDFSAKINELVTASVAARVAGVRTNLGNTSGNVVFTGATKDNLINALFTATLTGDIVINKTALPADAYPGTQFAMRLTQDATGNRHLTLTNIKKSFGVLDLSTSAGDTDLIVFFYDGATWYAGAMGLDFS